MSLVAPELWPQQLRSAAQPSGQFNLAEYLLGGKDPGRLAVAYPQVTYGELDSMVSRVAAALVAQGLKHGDRVLLHLPNSIEFIACWLGVLRAGGVNVAAMPLLRTRELSFILENSGARVAIGHARLWPELEPAATARPNLSCIVVGEDVGSPAQRFDELLASSSAHFEPIATDAEDIALIAYTSGSTGPPKGCAHCHGDVVGSIEGYSKGVLDARPDDVFVGNPSMAFTYGLGDLLVFPFAAGAATTIVAEPSIDALLATLVEARGTILFTVPITYKTLLKMTDAELRSVTSTLRRAVSAGERLPGQVYEEWVARTGVELTEGIGMTELFHIVISSRPGRVRPGITGEAVPGYVCRVVDAEFRDLPDGEPGLLAVQGPTRCRYWANDEKQRLYVQNNWNVPGDVFVRHADGYFGYLARNDDLIVTAGYNVSPVEIEEILVRHPAVKDAGVVGKPDDFRGQLVKAFVELAPGAKAGAELTTELQAFVKQEAAPYKYPREIQYLDALPRTETGKLSRPQLRRLAQDVDSPTV